MGVIVVQFLKVTSCALSRRSTAWASMCISDGGADGDGNDGDDSGVQCSKATNKKLRPSPPSAVHLSVHVRVHVHVHVCVCVCVYVYVCAVCVCACLCDLKSGLCWARMFTISSRASSLDLASVVIKNPRTAPAGHRASSSTLLSTNNWAEVFAVATGGG
jgi:hypothetical protein